MFGNSSPVRSSQVRPHDRLGACITRHRVHPYQRPLSANSTRLFDQIDAIRQRLSLPLILDSGCGNATSTLHLARQHPQALVIGIDKSAKRLDRYPLHSNVYHERNVIIARDDLVNFWQLAVHAGWRLEQHYLLYPNPWPKPGHLQRRWHAHPVFPTLVHLGGRLEVRSNWDLYIKEFAMTLATFGIEATCTRVESSADSISPFERKYATSGHPLIQLAAELS